MNVSNGQYLAAASEVQSWYFQLSRKYGEPKAGEDDYIQSHLAGVGL